MVNAGAIATTALIKGNGYDERFTRILQLFERFTGRPLSVDEAVFQSERATGHRNRAIAYLELNAGMLDEPIDEHLDLYFRQCSILVTARDLAVMAATLANNGVNPITGERAIGSEQVTSILSVMGSCGMYDFSGEWIYRVGLPAKSGVGGGIIAVMPGQFGVGTFSPRLDERGNSVRGIRVCEELSNRFRLHLFETHATAGSIVRRTYTGAAASSKRNRRASEQAIIDRSATKIVIYELQGDLYFATMEQLVRRIQQTCHS
jgi:glutaminase